MKSSLAKSYIPRSNTGRARNNSPGRIPIQETFCQANCVQFTCTSLYCANIRIRFEEKLGPSTFLFKKASIDCNVQHPGNRTRFPGLRIPYPKFRFADSGIILYICVVIAMDSYEYFSSALR